MPLGFQVRLYRVVEDNEERDDVTVGHMRRRNDVVRLVLLEACMPQGDFLLVVEPILVVGALACIQNPLLEAAIAARQIIGIGRSVEVSRVPGEMRNTGNDVGAPVIHDALDLIFQHGPGHAQIVLVFFGETCG